MDDGEIGMLKDGFPVVGDRCGAAHGGKEEKRKITSV